MEIVGIDVGFGFTKAYNGKNSVIFKSLIGDATDIQFQTSMGTESTLSHLHITYEDRSYFLGDFAELQSNIKEYTLDQDKFIKEFVRILAITSAALCCDTQAPLHVVSGLPVGYLKRDSKKLKEMIKGTHNITFHHQNGETELRTITVEEVLVIPQPIGSIFNLIFDDNGKISNKSLASQKLGVVDIGFKTSDFSIFDRLQYIERGSSTMDTGISKCFSVIASKLRQESNINIELYRMFKFTETGTIKIRGKEFNISNLTKRVYNHAGSAIASDLNRLWENDWDMDSIILSGGGSMELYKYLTPNIEGNVIPVSKDTDPRFNNVHGYLKFGRYKWGTGKQPISKLAPESPSPDEDKNQLETEDKDATAQDKPAKGLSWLRRQG